MNRRDFLKSSLAVAGAAAAACAGSCSSGGGKKERADGGMAYRLNPNSGDKVSLLGYGCMRWPLSSQDESVYDKETIDALVDKALERGVNYFDTAPVYCNGQSEKLTGEALARHDRSSFYVATKLSNFNPSLWSREKSLEMYRNSFRQLGVEYIDYYLLHSIGSIKAFNSRFVDNGILDFLLEEKAAGRIRNLGFSVHCDPGCFDYLMSLHDRYHWDFVQIQMNYVDWDFASAKNPKDADASYMYAELEKRGIPAVIMEPLLGGRLAGLPPVLAARLQEREPARSIASWAFRFCGTFPGVLTVLSGMTYMEHLEDNLATFSSFKPLDEAEMDCLHGIAAQLTLYPSVDCNDCSYCMPCPYGIDIPGLFRHYNKALNEDGLPVDGRDPLYRKLRRRYLASYGRAVPAERQADKCIGCGQCLPKCPQRLDIPAELRKLDDWVEKLRQQE